VAAVGAAAPAQHGELGRSGTQRPVLDTQLLRVAVVEVLGLVPEKHEGGEVRQVVAVVEDQVGLQAGIGQEDAVAQLREGARRPEKLPSTAMDVRIVGVNLPGRDWGAYENIHVGVQRKAEVVDIFPADVAEAVWEFEMAHDNGDFRGPYVQGRKGDRFFYLSWGSVGGDGTFAMFRRAKLMLAAIDGQVIEDAARPGHRLEATLGLTGGDGGPRCAALRPPAISWSAAPAG
jgi:hypothetical protein